MEGLYKLLRSTLVVCSELVGGRQGRGEPAASQVGLRENDQLGVFMGLSGEPHTFPRSGASWC